MALRFVRDEPGEWVTATQRLCLTEDGRLVPDTDPAARWLWCTPGQKVRRADAERFGLIGGKDADEASGKGEEKPEAKARRAVATKQRTPGGDK